MTAPTNSAARKHQAVSGRCLVELLVALTLVWAAIFTAADWFLGRESSLVISVPLASFASLALSLLWLRYRFRLTLLDVGLAAPAGSSMAAAVAGGFLCGFGWAIVTTVVLATTSGRSAEALLPGFGSLLLPFTPVGLCTIVVNPFWEEIVDRGLLMKWFRDRVGPAMGIVGQAIVATALHFDIPGVASWDLVVTRFLSACLLGVVVVIYRTLYASIACHAVINYIAAIV